MGVSRNVGIFKVNENQSMQKENYLQAAEEAVHPNMNFCRSIPLIAEFKMDAYKLVSTGKWQSARIDPAGQ